MDEHLKLDVLAYGAHPDDIELFCGGTVCLLTSQAYNVGIIDLTRGELGSRGSAALRQEESKEAARLAGISVRTNLGMPDGDIQNTFDNRLKIIRTLRRHRPDIVLSNAPECRHPDHGAASDIVRESVFYSGLSRISTFDAGEPQVVWRPRQVLQYIQAKPFEPSLVVDVSSVWEQRLKTVRAFKSQFYHEGYEASQDEPDTFISNPAFFKTIEARARIQGQRIGVEFGEGFKSVSGPVGITDLVSAIL